MPQIPGPGYGSWTEYLVDILPGVIFCVVLGYISRVIDDHLVPEHMFYMNYVMIAIILGLAARNLTPFPRALASGVDFSTKIFLYTGVVLLGAGLDLVQIFSVGYTAIAMVSISIALCILLCGALARWIGAGSRWGHLVGAGIGVCGVSAIMALAPAIRARKREIVTAIGAALVTDLLVLVTLPTLGRTLGWSDMLAGFFAGVVPSNTAQCIAIGHAYSDAAGAIATIVKSARNALMPAVILIMTYVYTARGLPVGEKARLGLLWSKFPKFIVGLLIAAAARTFGLLGSETVTAARSASTWLFVFCFVGIGAGIDIRDLGRQDLKVIGFGFLATIALGLYAYFYSRIILTL